LAQAQEAFALNAAYRDGVMKVVVDVPGTGPAATGN
jgi:hypothetical protein